MGAVKQRLTCCSLVFRQRMVGIFQAHTSEIRHFRHVIKTVSGNNEIFPTLMTFGPSGMAVIFCHLQCVFCERRRNADINHF